MRTEQSCLDVDVRPMLNDPADCVSFLMPQRTTTVNWVAPSTRIPVTPENRDLLRFLRAAELAAWEQNGHAE